MALGFRASTPRPMEKNIEFLGDSLDVIKGFPEPAKQRTGFELSQLQFGDMPTDFKPMKSVGAGAYEIRVSASGQAFRTVYVAKFEEAIYVLHAFEKKTQRTPQKDVETARSRYRSISRE